jgi:hypothetical protein
MHSIVNKTVAENFSSLEKGRKYQVQEVFRTTKRKNQQRNSPKHIVVKTLTIENKGSILKTRREK